MGPEELAVLAITGLLVKKLSFILVEFFFENYHIQITKRTF